MLPIIQPTPHTNLGSVNFKSGIRHEENLDLSLVTKTLDSSLLKI
jgi:hypothetical protein